jgi:hypothetical protein
MVRELRNTDIGNLLVLGVNERLLTTQPGAVRTR